MAAHNPKPDHTMKITCPHCRQSLEAAHELAGTAATCPACQGRFEVPFPPRTSSGITVVSAADRSPRDDRAFQSACRFLCGVLRTEFVLGCIGLLGVLMLHSSARF